MEEQWKNKIRNKMADYQEPAPNALWDKIDAAIDNQLQQSSQPKKEKKSRIVFWLSSIGSAAAVLALAFFTSNPPTSIITPKAASTTALLSENSEASVATKTSKTTVVTEYSEATVATEFSENSEHSETTIASENSEAAVAAENSEHTEAAVATQTAPHKSYYSPSNMTSISSIKSNSHLSASIYASNLPGSSSSTPGMGGHIPFASMSPAGANSEVFDPNELNILLSQKRENKDITKTTHRLPVKVGLSVRYNFNDRWGIETGITYSHLSSHISSGSEQYSKEIEQKLNFIGIPLKASFSIWQNNRWNIYASAGGAVEKCVSGTADIDNVLNGTVVSTENETVTMKQLQLSAAASAGVQVNILPNLGLYAEPGINYYFDNGSSIETIYSDKPLNFNLQFGLRITFK